MIPFRTLFFNYVADDINNNSENLNVNGAGFTI